MQSSLPFLAPPSKPDGGYPAGWRAVPLAVGPVLASAGVLTVTGMLGCVVLIERGHGLHRALHLLSLTPPVGPAGTAFGVAVLPRVVAAAGGGFAMTVVSVAAALVWSAAALVTYARAGRVEGPVSSASLHDELATPEIY